MHIAMTSVAHPMDSISLIRRPSDSPCNASGLELMKTPQEGRFSGYERPNDNFYEPYVASASNYASSSNSICGAQRDQQQGSAAPLSRCSSWSAANRTPYVQYRGSVFQHSQLLDDGNVGINTQLPAIQPALISTLARDLPPADPDTDYMDHLSPITAEGPLSPLSFFRDWQASQLPLDPLHNEIYIPSIQLPRQLDQKECNRELERDRGSSMHSDDENDTSPERRPYPPLLDMGIGYEWMTSPESVDTDLDDESVLSCSTSSLSPPYPDSDLRHFIDSEEYMDDMDDDDLDLYLPHAFALPGSSSTTPSPPTDIYHPLDQYPSDYQHLYKSNITSTPPLPPPLTLHEPPLSEPPPPPPPPIPEPSAPVETSNMDPPPQTLFSQGPSSSFTSPLSAELYGPVPFDAPTATPSPAVSPRLFGTLCEFDFDGEPLPCSPSRRRSTELPSVDDDADGPFALPGTDCGSRSRSSSTHPTADGSSCRGADQAPGPRSQRTQWLNLPGAETDDDLIPTELASKNYVPDPTITVPSSQPTGSLLIWGPTSATRYTFPSACMSDFLPPASARSSSPEASSIDLDLDSATLAELAPKGAAEDAQKLWEMRVRTARSETWERERCRELEALLRLKLRWDEKRGGIDADADVDSAQPATAGPLRSASHPCSNPSTSGNSLSQQRSPPRRSSSSKGRITNMAQLVANMVFHRQQESSSPKRSHHAAPRSSITSSPIAAATKTHPTPRSPLRQVTLPGDLDEADDDDDDCLSPLSPLSPLTPFGLCESPLSYLTELGPKEHDFP